jgi:glycosyltransferase involved in cell wall biosynthesis
MKSQRIIAVHLLNDGSGSPLVFRQALEVLQQTSFEVVLYTATPSGNGFLSNMDGVVVRPIRYQCHSTRLLSLWHYLRVQLSLFLRLLFSLQSTDCVYINTLLPFGAALAGWLRGCRVVYHVHEVSVQPPLLKAWLLFVANRTAQQVLFVSVYTLRQSALTRPVCSLLYNALPTSFAERAVTIQEPNMSTHFTVLMLCPIRVDKGIYEFIAIARTLPHMRFLLVLSADQKAVNNFVTRSVPPANCFVFSAQTDTLPFYQQAHIVLNLSRPDGCVEAFGMTILEAMSCGRPVIIPTVGGIGELIEDGKEGFKLDALQPPKITQVLGLLSSDIHLYINMARAARRRAVYFSTSKFQKQVLQIFTEETLPSSLGYSVEKKPESGKTNPVHHRN